MEKEQTKDWQRNLKQKTKSQVLPCYAHVSSSSRGLCWDLKIASGVKMQTLGLDPWQSCGETKRAVMAYIWLCSASVLVHPSVAIHKSL